MVMFRSKKDLKMLYEIQDDGQELKGVIYSPEGDESKELVLVFENHTLTITEEGIVCVNRRYKNAVEAHDSQSLSTEQEREATSVVNAQDIEKIKLGTRYISQSSAWRKGATYTVETPCLSTQNRLSSAYPCRFHEFPGMYSQ